MTDPYETRQPWAEWDAQRDALFDSMGFTDEWEAKMTRKQELKQSIFLNQQAIRLLEVEGKHADSAREAIRRARREIWQIDQAQPVQNCVNW